MTIGSSYVEDRPVPIHEDMPEHMTRMRVNGTYDKQANKFRVTVEFYNPEKGVWENRRQTVLARATRRKVHMFGTLTTPEVTTHVGGSN